MTSWPRDCASFARSWPSIPPAPVTSSRISGPPRTIPPRIPGGLPAGIVREEPLEDPDLRVVADHEPVRARLRGVAVDADVAAQQARLHPAGKVGHAAAREQDRMLELGLLDRAILADRAVGPHVRVDQLRVRADDRRPAYRRSHERRARLDDDAPVDARGVVEVPVDALVDGVED